MTSKNSILIIPKSGFDTRLQKQCATGEPEEALFKSNKHFCHFLKNEELHQNCFWNDRLAKYKENLCIGDFSPEPPLIAPPIDPNPEPQPQPKPVKPTDPLDQILVVQYLRSNGIEVSVDWQAIRDMERVRLPNDPPLDQKMELFWKELEANQDQIVNRKTIINEIIVSIYTNYRQYSTENKLFLDYETPSQALTQYFPLFDEILDYSIALDIDFSFIHSGYGDEHPYKPLVEILSTIKKNQKTLFSMKGLFKEIDLESYSSYFSFSRSLNIDRNNIEADFEKFIQLLKPLSPIYTWTSNNNIDFESDFDIEKDSSKVYSAFTILEKSLSSLDQMTKAEMINEISLHFFENEVNYWSSLKKLSISVEGTNKDIVSKILNSLGKQAQISLDLQIPIQNSNSELDQDYLTALSILQDLKSLVKSKSLKISKITLGYESQYYEYSQELIIGYQTSKKKTEEIISKIP